MPQFIIFLSQLDRDSLPLVGGKGANLGELLKCDGIQVPPGFCVTTEAYRTILEAGLEQAWFFAELDRMEPGDAAAAAQVGGRIRQYIEGTPIPAEFMKQLREAVEQLGRDEAYAVRSSATAEDLPQASFAGQQDTYLNIQGIEELAQHIRKCWASLFTDRAIVYRNKNRFDHRKVLSAVVVQRMIVPEASGILFTADPVSGNRNVISIDAGFGLGEALVSGKVNADLYKVRKGRIIKKQIGDKRIAIFARPGTGTVEEELPEYLRTRPALSDEQLIKLAEIGKAIEAHFGTAQDIEWCLAGGEFYIVQSRPITTLYPLPETGDDRPRVWLSFGHAQMMTDPIRPLGISILKRLMPPSYEMAASGGRLYLNFNEYLTSRFGRTMAKSFGKTDLLLSSAIAELMKRREFMATLKEEGKRQGYGQMKKMILPMIAGSLGNMATGTPGEGLPQLRESVMAIVAEVRSRLEQLSGEAKLCFIEEQAGMTMGRIMEKMMPPLVAAFFALDLITRLSRRWLGAAPELADLVKSPSGNITSEMGLALGDLADVIREYPAVISYLRQAEEDTFWPGLDACDGGGVVRLAFTDFLRQYGMRCPGEIDLTRPRWREQPTQLIPAILSHIQSMAPGEHRRKFTAGEAAAGAAAEAILERLEKSRGGAVKVRIMARLIRVYRALIGLREYPKYFMISLFDVFKKALMEEAEELVRRGALRRAEDVYYLFLEELEEAIRTGRVDEGLIAERKEEYREYERLTPPRLMTSEGEVLSGTYEGQDAPEGSLLGTPVSSGVIEGRARVIIKPDEGSLDKGDILIAPFTDPGWTPFFASASGLVTEIGGQMTHGSVIAREYGIPAVVGVEEATRLIRDGQWIRVNGSQGYVELLE
jgi:pyruvate,water dikinase